jgi:hypothetical protein
LWKDSILWALVGTCWLWCQVPAPRFSPARCLRSDESCLWFIWWFSNESEVLIYIFLSRLNCNIRSCILNDKLEIISCYQLLIPFINGFGLENFWTLTQTNILVCFSRKPEGRTMNACNFGPH